MKARNYRFMRKTCVILLALGIHDGGIQVSRAFTTTSQHLRVRSTNTAATTTTISSSLQSSLSSSPGDIFVLSYDGVVADTNQWRSNLAIDVALQTWPQLSDYASIEEDRTWLLNKISALLPVTLSGTDGMMGCDAVLLARLLMEEQLLDEGRSVGCKGKYGSKFHPSTSDEVGEYSKRDLKSRQGSRPLTVGEIAANWNDGACLKDTVRIRYNVDRKDPIPVIRSGIQHCLENIDNRLLPTINPSISDALLDCGSAVYILVGHRSHLPTATASMSHLSIPIHTIHWDDDDAGDEGFAGGGGVRMTIIPPPPRRNCGHDSVLESIVMSAKEGSSVHAVHLDISVLRNAKSLFGDNRPRSVGAFGASARDGVELKLSLPTMGSGPQEQNDAEMDPWLNVIHEFDLVENLSARIISK